MLKMALLDQRQVGYDLDYSTLESFGTLTCFDNTTEEELVDRLREFNVSIQNRVPFSRTTLEALPHLKLICLTATGTNTIDLKAARERGIAVCNIAGYSTDSVAQHTCALLLGLMERLAHRDALVKKRNWETGALYNDFGLGFREIAGKRWGIIGMGQIGRKTAEIAEAFGAEVVYTSPSGSTRSERWPRVDKEALFSGCDIISIHAPINDRTRNYIEAGELQSMKKSALLLNVGRGGIIDEADLAAALDRGTIAGAGLDVLAEEPPAADNPLLHLKHPERILLTPHMAWSAIEARQRAVEEIFLNIEAFLRKEKRNRVE